MLKYNHQLLQVPYKEVSTGICSFIVGVPKKEATNQLYQKRFNQIQVAMAHS